MSAGAGSPRLSPRSPIRYVPGVGFLLRAPVAESVYADDSKSSAFGHARSSRARGIRDESIAPLWLWKLALGILCGFLLYAVLNAPAVEAATATRFCRRADLTPYQAIDCVWPRALRGAAKRVAECESTASAPTRVARRNRLGRWARDYASGTHIGVFQLGPAERRAHGWYEIGAPALIQVKAARSLHKSRGWQPWVCKP